MADATPPGTNVRTRVHEFGGAAFTVHDGTIFFSEFSDQRVYRLKPGGSPEPMTPPGPWRYADATVDPLRRRLICIREDHSGKPSGDFSRRDDAKNPPRVFSTLVSLAVDGPASAGDVVASGYDFYAAPRFSPDGHALAWLAWRHPQMPWDGTELWLASIAGDGRLGTPRLIAGGDRESIFQPGWSPDGALHFVSDRTGWWNLYRFHGGAVEEAFPIDADCGRPLWTLGTSTWAFAGRRAVVARAHHGRWSLGGDAQGWEPAEFLAANARHIVFVGGTATSPDSIVRVDVATGDADVLRASQRAGYRAHDFSIPQSVHFPTSDGAKAHAFYYPPSRAARVDTTNEEAAIVETSGGAPPLVVMCHGGPTGATHARLNLEIQFWTSRGFAVADVNYRGSTGFGRAYRDSLNGCWGVADVDDCVNAVRFFAERGLANGARAVVRGRSAGGFTALCALTSFPDVFAAGAIYYGVGDLERLARDTHKFESRYLDRLIGPYPETRELYVAHSPIHRVDRLSCPVILFQGMDDQVVPPGQTEAIVRAVRARGVPVEYLTFPGEGHGFRRAETIARCLEAEYNFIRRHVERT